MISRSVHCGRCGTVRVPRTLSKATHTLTHQKASRRAQIRKLAIP